MYDAIIVGARCAGSPTAMLLARQGYKVLLVDRASFPSDIPKGNFIQPAGVAYLKRWGLLDRVIATGAPAVRSRTFDFGPLALRGSPRWPTGQVAEAYAPLRPVVDQILVEAALAAGAELREHFSVDSLLTEDGRVTGIRGRTNRGAVAESARIVIGADGTYSRVARAVAAPMYETRPALSGAYWAYWSGVRLDGVEFYLRPRRFAVAFPTNDGLVCVAGQWPLAELPAVRADLERSFFALLDLAPSLAERVRGGRRETSFVGRLDLHNHFRKPFGPGWALVGDAGYLKDPITGQGMGDAFRDGELLAEAIDDGFAGRRPLDEALADYERRRNEQVMPMYEYTNQLASLELPSPETQELLRALQGNQASTDRFLGTLAGTVPIPEFFAPENVRQIIGDPAPATAGRVVRPALPVTTTS